MAHAYSTSLQNASLLDTANAYASAGWSALTAPTTQITLNGLTYSNLQGTVSMSIGSVEESSLPRNKLLLLCL